MLNAGIISTSRSTLPKILRFLVAPKVEDAFTFAAGSQEVRIHIIRLPLWKEHAIQQRANKMLIKLCERLDIGYTVINAGASMTKTMQGDLRNSGMCDSLEEIQAIKALGALIKVSQERNNNLLTGNIGFAAAEINPKILDVLSEDAAGIMIYEHLNMREAVKETIYNRLIRQNGISTVFTKDLEQLVKACDVILTDGETKLEGFEDRMKGKVLLGESNIDGGFKKIEKVILWNEALKDLSEANKFVLFNDALLAVARSLNMQDSYIDFLKRFPHIYLI